MALVNTNVSNPASKPSANMSGKSGFMNGSPPVKPTSSVPRPSATASRKYAATSERLR